MWGVRKYTYVSCVHMCILENSNTFSEWATAKAKALAAIIIFARLYIFQGVQIPLERQAYTWLPRLDTDWLTDCSLFLHYQ